MEELLNIAVNAAKTAGSIILNSIYENINVTYKGSANLVTNIDRETEKVIIDEIINNYPKHSILAEESGFQQNDSKYTWCIDPIDGTTNFVHGYPSFGVSIGVLYENSPQIGVVLELPANNIYTGLIGNGAYKNGNKISVSKTSKLIDSLLVTGFGYEHGNKWDANMKLFKHFTDKTQGVRRLGAASIDLCHVASGIVDGYWEFDLQPWDSAAGIVILEEAGGKITKTDGNIFSIYDKQILASNGLLHEEIITNMQMTVSTNNF